MRAIPKRTFLMILTSALCLAPLNAGFYRITTVRYVNPQDPTDIQYVTFFFDKHNMGTREQNQEQLRTIERQIDWRNENNLPLQLLVEAPNYYYLEDFGYLDQDLRNLPKENFLRDQQGHITNQLRPDVLWSYRCSIFYALPCQIGSRLRLRDSVFMDVVDPRWPAIESKDIRKIDNSEYALLNMQQANEALAVFGRLMNRWNEVNNLSDKNRTIYEPILNNSRRQLDAFNSYITNMHHPEVRSHSLAMDITSDSTGEVMTIDPSKTIVVNVSPDSKIPEQRRVNILMAYENLHLFLDFLDGDVLYHILKPGASKNIGVFVGGSHAKNIIKALKRGGYEDVARTGFSENYAKREIKFTKDPGPYGSIAHYPRGINELIVEGIRAALRDPSAPRGPLLNTSVDYNQYLAQMGDPEGLAEKVHQATPRRGWNPRPLSPQEEQKIEAVAQETKNINLYTKLGKYFYATGIYDPGRYDQGRDYLRRAIKLGSAIAARSLADVARSDGEETRLIIKSATLGDHRAMIVAARWYITGSNPHVEKDIWKGKKILDRLIRLKGADKLMPALGQPLDDLVNFSQKVIREAAAQKVQRFIQKQKDFPEEIPQIPLEPIEDLPPGEKRMQAMEKAFATGQKKYALAISEAHAYGTGVEPDVDRAIAWLKTYEKHMPIAERPEAAFKLGLYLVRMLIDQGRFEEGREWLMNINKTPGGTDIVPESLSLLAGLYERGQGVTQSYREAARLYVQAAAKGHNEAFWDLYRLAQDNKYNIDDLRKWPAAQNVLGDVLGKREEEEEDWVFL